MSKRSKAILSIAAWMVLPFASHAQGMANDMNSYILYWTNCMMK